MLPFLALLLIAETENRVLLDVDGSVATALNTWVSQRPWLITVLDVVSVATSPWTFRLAVLIAAVLLWRAGFRRSAAWAMATMAVGGVANAVLKIVVARARPVFDDPVASASHYSFPSGHATHSALGVGIILLIVLPVLARRGRVLAWVLGLSVILLTGFDRVGLGVHFLSDVIAGWLLAAALVAASAPALGAWRRHWGTGPGPHTPRRRSAG